MWPYLVDRRVRFLIMSLITYITKTYESKERRGWKTIYWLIDLHDTIIPGNYTKNNDGKQFYPYAKETLQLLSKRQDTVLILWTSGHLQPSYDAMDWMKEQGINFTYLNANPLEKDTELCDFTKKMYFNILLDDKSGYDGEKDWESIYNLMKGL